MLGKGAGQQTRRRASRTKRRLQLPEALDRQLRLADLLLAVALPQGFVDALIVRKNAGRERQAGPDEGPPQGFFLGPVEVEEGLVGVEQDRAQPGQGRATWRGR
jgi:hypothetical protein